MKIKKKLKNLTKEELEMFGDEEVEVFINHPSEIPPGQKYYQLTKDGQVYVNEWGSFGHDIHAYQIGNFFLDLGEAYKVRELLVIKKKLFDLSEKVELKEGQQWYIGYKQKEKKLMPFGMIGHSYVIPFTPVFASDGECQKAINSLTADEKERLISSF